MELYNIFRRRGSFVDFVNEIFALSNTDALVRYDERTKRCDTRLYSVRVGAPINDREKSALARGKVS